MNDAGAITSMLVPNSRSWPIFQTVIGCTPKVRGDDQVVPRPEELEDRERGDRGESQREHQADEDGELLAPSIRADSRMSFGIPTKKLRSRKIANGNPNAVWKRMVLRTVPKIRPCREVNIGISAIWSGRPQTDDRDEEPVAARNSSHASA